MNKHKQQAGNRARGASARALWVARKSEIVAMYHERGLSQAQIAEHYGMAQSALHKVMKRLRIKPKSRGRKGARNGRYIHGKASTLYRKMVKKSKCARCSAGTNLCVHHKDGNHFNDAIVNLEVLCMSCHSSEHKREWWARQKQS